MPTATVGTDVRSLPDLIDSITGLKSIQSVIAALRSDQSGTIDGAWGSACALAAAAVVHEATSPVLIVLPRMADVDDFAADLASFLNQPPLIFPAWETLPQEQSVADAVFGGRLRVMRELESAAPPPVILTSIPALLQPVPSRDARDAGTRSLSVGEEIDLDELLEWLLARGFERTTAVEVPGEFSLHGGILDIYAPDAIDPMRIELFGDEIESIRQFDVESQRRVDSLDAVQLTIIEPVSQDDTEAGTGDGSHLVESLPPGSWVVLSELVDLVDEGKHYLTRLDNPRGLFSVKAALAQCTKFPSVTISAITAASAETTCHLQIESIERLTQPKTEMVQELATIVGVDERIVIACHNEGERERLDELLTQGDPALRERADLCIGSVSQGFRLVAHRRIVVGDNELFGRAEVHRATRKKRVETRAIDSFLELSEGGLVVHLAHGIARYRGMELLTKEGHQEEHLVLEFRDAARIYVPISLIHLVQKYVGPTKAMPRLSKLGTTSWAKKKARVSEAVTDMAADMLRLQAARDSQPGLSCPPDSHFQQEFAAAFPYVETADQVSAIDETKHDLMLSRPMDRLICGDVGFGKTEVAMRAAFKVVDSGRQVAILVPTTILAEQHYRSFCERMAEFPVNIAQLSRFKTKREQRETLAKMEAGAVDIVIGTHRLVQKDVKFQNLGLLIVDEEQRFGVGAKEMLKQLRLAVDVLTLSATPIPRTLHMSLLGVRDISNLTTPPRDRVSITTRVTRFDEELIRSAIVRELNRGGQVYFVHNRVYNIRQIADRIQAIVPEASIGIVHGQMNERELEMNMVAFVSGKLDILVATTIIESGLDIPNANTMFIHQADKYGLADLHQLRGRVGRHKHRAYCYLLLEEGRTLSGTATKRLKAIEEYSDLGAGFKIAMRDLEIRGAGNILGTEQSGHIASVGYELYCQLLEDAARKLKNQAPRRRLYVNTDLPISAFLPNSYVPPGRPKVDIYRKLSTVSTHEELSEVSDELRDRFGPIPTDAQRLLDVKEMSLYASAWGIESIRLEERFAVFGYNDAQMIHDLAGRTGRDLRIVDTRNAYWVLPDPGAEGDQLLQHLVGVLR